MKLMGCSPTMYIPMERGAASELFQLILVSMTLGIAMLRLKNTSHSFLPCLYGDSFLPSVVVSDIRFAFAMYSFIEIEHSCLIL